MIKLAASVVWFQGLRTLNRFRCRKLLLPSQDTDYKELKKKDRCSMCACERANGSCEELFCEL